MASRWRKIFDDKTADSSSTSDSSDSDTNNLQKNAWKPTYKPEITVGELL